MIVAFKIKITFPDGKVWLYSIYDAVVQVVDFYEFEKVFNWKPRMRDENFLLKHVPYGQDKMYREIRSGQYFRCNVSYKDHLNILRMINIHFGNKLKIELQ